MDFSVRNLFEVDVYAPDSGRNVLFKIEVFDNNQDGIEVMATTTVANEWETLTFDFSGSESGRYGKIILFMDFLGTNAGETWYFDNVAQAQAPMSYDDGILVDFENVNPYWFDFAANIVENYTGGLTIIENPFKEGINTSEMVGSFITTDALNFDGSVVVERYVPFDFSEGAAFKIKVYSEQGGSNFLFQLEHFDNGSLPLGRVFVIATTGPGFEWEELTFDFGSLNLQSGFYSKIVVMPDFDGTSDGEEWIIDDIVFVPNLATSVENSIPTNYKLYAKNYPNPFNPVTTINYSIPSYSLVQLDVFNVLGEKVATLVNERKPAGFYAINFNGSNLSSGVYFCKLTGGKEIVSHKMLLMK